MRKYKRFWAVLLALALLWGTLPMALAAQPIPRFVFGERKLRVMRFGPVLPETPDRLGSLPVSLLEKPLVVNPFVIMTVFVYVYHTFFYPAQ